MKGKRGSVLATVVIVAAALFALVGVTYTYFTMNARTMAFTMNRTRALASAEAGVALAVHHLQSLDELPEGDPFLLSMEGDSMGWTMLPGGGRAMVVIDPYNGTLMAGLGNGSVQIRTEGLAGNVSREVVAGASPAYPSSFALLTDGGIGNGFFSDGREINGAVHSNGVIEFSSYSPDSTGDPKGEMFSTTSDGGFRFSDSGFSTVPHPEGSSIWVRPYANHRQGSPYWRPCSPPVDFSRMSSHFRNLASSAEGVRITAARLLLDGNRVRFKETEGAEERVLDLSGVDLLLVENGFSPVIVKSVRRLEEPLTILARSDLIIGGGIDGGVAGSGGPLGLVSLGSVVIADDPDLSGTGDWPGDWQIETDGAMLIRASVVAAGGGLRAATPYRPQEQTRVTVSGSLTQVQMGRLSSANSGYELGISWDQGLGALHPPHFPMLGRWNVFSWLVDPPDQGDIDITDDLV
ncbi:MAG TPA: hypothetical protein PLM22_07180 [Candidatus Sabulitectum sp.]|nr:hypothetical protein [Candidatus Sabulitectum sp.]HPJ28701.1 hypothetical protein [Candidatus Sabulitectum sp.]